ncbi:AVIToxin-VAR1 [Varanus komodoensis]|nr:AVIToxin-VAR1 [Varanus komodoensis]
MRSLLCVPLLLLLLSAGESAVITGEELVKQACDKDLQCGEGMCCAVSLWIRSIRICTPLGSSGEDCHPLSHKVSMLSWFHLTDKENITPVHAYPTWLVFRLLLANTNVHLSSKMCFF